MSSIIKAMKKKLSRVGSEGVDRDSHDMKEKSLERRNRKQSTSEAETWPLSTGSRI